MKILSRTGTPAGVASDPPGTRRTFRTRAAVVASFVATGLISSSVVVPGLAAAAVPTFPDNLVVFPNRDFVTIEGYQDRVGQTATIQVLRGTQVVGSAQGVVEAGDVAFEVNHPGGYCWGAGTSLQVTPDIVAGDKVTISFDGAVVGDTTVQDAAVDAKATASGTTVTVTGHVAAGVNAAQLEQRVVNPDLTGTSIARRDIRAVPGPLTASPKGGYSSGLAINGTTATATYEFNGPDAANVAAIVARGGGERMMSWQVEDAAANRQGLTIAEQGELGGPGMGGCPVGPTQQNAPKPGEATVVRSADKTKVQVSWTPATPAPGAAPVTGYSVEAIAATKGAGGEQTGSLVRVPATATAATISNLVATENYSVEVRSITGTLLSDAFTAPAAGGGTGTGTGGGTPNATFGRPTAGTTVPVTLTNAADGTGAEIYYTTDGSDPRVADLPSDKAIRYTAPITITAPNTTLNFVAFKADGSFSDTGTAGPFQPGASTGLPVPTGVSVAGGIELATVKWALVPGATKYVVTATPPTPGAPVVVEGGATATSIDVKPLVGGTSYNVTVAAANASGTGAASAPIAVTPAVNTVPRVSITSARYKTGDFRVVGTSSATSGTVSVYASNPNATPAPSPIAGMATQPLVAAVAPATGTTFDVRLRAGVPPKPAQVWVKTSNGGVAGPFTVTNG
jgi:Chitobiase/beta-hexosaminidase C-terminal domain/Fibronectin type III domain